MRKFFCGSLLFLMIFASFAMAAPKPAIIQNTSDWTVDVTFEHPQQITLRLPGAKKAELFWYTIITITNKTNGDVDFYPSCDLMTETFQLLPADKGVPAGVFQGIKKRHVKEYPFLENLPNIDNRMLQGLDNAKDIVIIWPDFDLRAKNIKLFIKGLSNETVTIDHPRAKDPNGKPVKIYLRKSLELNYKVTSDPEFRARTNLIYENKKWVMR